MPNNGEQGHGHERDERDEHDTHSDTRVEEATPEEYAAFGVDPDHVTILKMSLPEPGLPSKEFLEWAIAQAASVQISNGLAEIMKGLVKVSEVMESVARQDKIEDLPGKIKEEAFIDLTELRYFVVSLYSLMRNIILYAMKEMEVKENDSAKTVEMIQESNANRAKTLRFIRKARESFSTNTEKLAT